MPGQIITDQQGLFDILKQTRTIATIGARDQGPAHDIPQYLADHGYTVIPISPKLTEAFGQKAYTSVDLVEQPVDVVQIFRRSEAVIEHVDEILRMNPRPRVVWMQLGISNDEAAAQLNAQGIDVVMDHCMFQEHRRMMSQQA